MGCAGMIGPYGRSEPWLEEGYPKLKRGWPTMKKIPVYNHFEEEDLEKMNWIIAATICAPFALILFGVYVWYVR